MTVLVLADDIDPTVDRVVDLLNQRGVPLLRLDTAWFPTRLRVEAELVDGRWVGSLHTPHRQVPLDELRSVWYRHPTGFTFPAGWSAAARRHAAYEAKFGLGGVLSSLPVLWMNHPGRQADLYKPTQLTAARRCGLAAPDTLVTNRPERVREFAAAHPGGVVVKPLGLSAVEAGGGRAMLHTHLLTGDDLADLAGVEVTMHLFQAYVRKELDVRLTAVGTRLFAAAITTEGGHQPVDFRTSYRTMQLHTIDIPDTVATGVHRFLDHFGLTYGAFDFAVDHRGWWLLECNSAGQYGFVEQRTGLPISDAIADLLQKGPQ